MRDNGRCFYCGRYNCPGGVYGCRYSVLLASWSTYTIEKRASIREAEKLLRKYQDPLLLAARDLQARLYNILLLGILSFAQGTEDHQDALFIYNTYLMGQYLLGFTSCNARDSSSHSPAGGKRLSRTQVFVRITNRITDLLNTEFLHDDTSDLEVERWTTPRWWTRRRRGDEPRDAEQGHGGRWTIARWWTSR